MTDTTIAEPLPDAPAAATSKRERPRKSRLKIDKAVIAQRVVDFFTQDNHDRADDMEARLQRYAKFRQWTEGNDLPWENASDCALPDLMTQSLKVQDTLHNAVMSTRPALAPKALQAADRGKEQNVGDLLDAQFFVENKGELIVGEMAEAFVNDGVVTVFTPWVKEEREHHDILTLPRIPAGENPEMYFHKFLRGAYPGKIFRKRDAAGWSWEVMQDEKTWFDVEFYTTKSGVEMDAQRNAVVFDAPRPIVKDYEDILAPVRCANLQIPSPSNPGGAAHVVMVDYPTLDEVKRLEASGFYDLLDAEDLEKLEITPMDGSTGQQEKRLKDALQGVQENQSANDGKGEGKSPDHNTLTRLTCFDLYDIDGDGVNEDVIFWVILETKTLLRVRELTQVYPANPPRRPFAEGAFLPVRGRRAGISLLEMIEGLHDMIKQILDQSIDGGTMKLLPFFFYRASSNMRPEVIRLWPGEGYPLANPQQDVHFPQFNNQGDSFAMNMISLLSGWQEKNTNVGDLQLGRVPQGKSSALRTARGMQGVLAQGDARPERILRRFMMCFAEVGAQMHELNQVYLPREKQFRVYGVMKANEDPYRTVKDPSAIRGRFQFDFKANAMNTSKEALQQALDEFGAAFLNPIMIQAGIAQPDGMYQWLRDKGKALGQDVDKYLSEPTPESRLPKYFAEEVISFILAGNMPEGRPAEPTMDHLKKLMEFAGEDEFGYLNPDQVNVFKAYLAQLRQRTQAEAQKAALMAAAAQGQMGGQGGAPGPEGTAPIDMSQAPLSPNELLDESLPPAGGGANPGMLQ